MYIFILQSFVQKNVYLDLRDGKQIYNTHHFHYQRKNIPNGKYQYAKYINMRNI